MSYEYLIRRAHNCGRYGVEGANADIFRTLERECSLHATALNEIENNLPRTWGEDVKVLESNSRNSTAEVAYHIVNAIWKAQDRLDSRLTDEEQRVFEDCKIELNTPTLEKINEVIKKAEEIMMKHGLYPG